MIYAIPYSGIAIHIAHVICRRSLSAVGVPLRASLLRRPLGCSPGCPPLNPAPVKAEPDSTESTSGLAPRSA
ncbi:hypothetical protein EVAR_92610_1 [Eumeta japonica]|uniref:Uncharacterized protein n=1 Tax=Eumeta variegata TaxID=151549 RepID=A0A4C1SZL7_EUMVA|nr:hypothetical protein EVAR_92610_1 [Eumeta japonica]